MISIAIASDLHCRYSNGRSLDEVNTYLTSDLIGVDAFRHPIRALQKLIKENTLTADVLLCPGDIADKTDAQGLITGWSYLNDIKTSLKAKLLAATVGNHDVDSRGNLALTTPFDNVKALSDYYPTPHKDKNRQFWSDHFCIVEESDCLVLLVNTSYSHLNAINAAKCVLGTQVLDRIREDLEVYKNFSGRRVCLLHHHPIHHSNMTYDDSDYIERGDRLLSLLSDHFFDIVIHGHKHQPRLINQGDLVIFAAGTFSSLMNIKDTGGENTFHIINLESAQKGKIRSWVYGPSSGWEFRADTQFPCFTGFGSKSTPDDIAAQCNTLVGPSGFLFYNCQLPRYSPI